MGRIGQPPKDLQIRDKRVHLRQHTRHTIEGTNVRRATVTLGDAPGVGCTGSSLPISVGFRIVDHLVRVRYPNRAESLEVQPEVIAPQ